MEHASDCLGRSYDISGQHFAVHFATILAGPGLRGPAGPFLVPGRSRRPDLVLPAPSPRFCPPDPVLPVTWLSVPGANCPWRAGRKPLRLPLRIAKVKGEKKAPAD